MTRHLNEDILNSKFEPQNLKQETEETPIEKIKTLGETCRNTRGNGRKQLGNRGNITLRESP